MSDTKIYAKSNPPETLKEHTARLLENLEILRRIYGEKIESTLPDDVKPIFWDLLYDACLHHDLGKVHTPFQNKIRKILDEPLLPSNVEEEVPHNLLSPAFLDRKRLREKYGREYYEILVQAIIYHHEREDDLRQFKEMVKDAIKLDLSKRLEDVKREMQLDIEKLNMKYTALLDPRRRIKSGDEHYKFYVLVKGLLHRLDHAASAQQDVEIETGEDIRSLTINYIEKKLNSKLRDLQTFALENSNDNLLVVASTGMGKTEAAFLWSNNEKLFFTLPMRTLLNAMYSRIRDNLGYSNVGLLHSSSLVYLEEVSEDLETAYNVYQQSRQFARKVNLTTMDQIFPFVFKYPGYEKIYATLSYSRVVVDEIQAYSPHIMAAISKGLEMIHNMGGKFMVMTATLPGIFKRHLNVPVVEEKFLLDKTRHKVKLWDERIETAWDLISELSKDNKILVVVNTIAKAVELYKTFQENGIKARLLHSLFIRKDRAEKEREIKAFSDDPSATGVWITTQIVEASLDVDFDYLFTELSTLDSLFQRMGRCYRKRDYDLDGMPNVHVFLEGIKGIGPVYDPDIHAFSREILEDFDGELLSEENKLEMVNLLYSPEKIEGTKYYEHFKKAIDVIENTLDYEHSKEEVHRTMREMRSVEVIPYEIFNENYDLFEAFTRSKGEERWGLLTRLNKLTLSFPVHKARDNVSPIKGIKGLYILNLPYSKEEGVKLHERISSII